MGRFLYFRPVFVLALVTFAFGHAVILPFPASFARHIFERLFLDFWTVSLFRSFGIIPREIILSQFAISRNIILLIKHW